MSLPYMAFEKDQRVTHTAVVENKRLNEALAFVQELQAQTSAAPRILTNSEQIAYVPNGRKQGRPRA